MLKTLLFNKGIYKSNLSRFKWGSILYFVILFFSTSFMFLIDKGGRYSSVRLEQFVNAGGMILLDEWMAFPVLLATFVPTVVAFLVFDMFSSKKHSVFIHSLPCGRCSIYISALLGAFTLMALPVIANGVILILLSVFKCGELFSVLSCMKWIAVNLVLLFIMFSVSVFSAGITSSRVALVFINAVLHFLPLVIAFGMSGIAAAYLYGFNDSSDVFIKTALEWTPSFSHWMSRQNGAVYSGNSLAVNLLSTRILIFVAGAILLYALGILLYKKRNVESAGNFVAFKILNPILKYTLTVLGTVGTFSILQYSNFERNFYMVFLLVAVSLILYFASEMVLKKNLKVIGAYKGYLIFAAAMILLNTFIQHTGFFGYETRVPDVSEVESVSISGNWNYRNTFTDDKDVILEAVCAHESIIKDIPSVIEPDRAEYWNMYITYKLKNGREITRRYNDLSEEEHLNIMTALYEHIPYRLAADEVNKIEVGDLDFLRISFRPSNEYGYSFNIEGRKNMELFLAEWRRDIEILGYNEKENTPRIMDLSPMYKEEYYKREEAAGNNAYAVYDASFNANFKNVMKFLENGGYLDTLYNAGDYKCFISKETHKVETKKDEDEHTYVEFSNAKQAFYSLKADDVVPVSQDDVKNLFKDVLSGKLYDTDTDGEYYVIYLMNNGTDILERYTKFLSVTPDRLPEYMLKYIQ